MGILFYPENVETFKVQIDEGRDIFESFTNTEMPIHDQLSVFHETNDDLADELVSSLCDFPRKLSLFDDDEFIQSNQIEVCRIGEIKPVDDVYDSRNIFRTMMEFTLIKEFQVADTETYYLQKLSNVSEEEIDRVLEEAREFIPEIVDDEVIPRSQKYLICSGELEEQSYSREYVKKPELIRLVEDGPYDFNKILRRDCYLVDQLYLSVKSTDDIEVF